MKVLVACEYSGIVRDAFTKKGHDALPDKEKHRIWWIGSGKGKERSKFYTGIADAMADQWGMTHYKAKDEN